MQRCVGCNLSSKKHGDTLLVSHNRRYCVDLPGIDSSIERAPRISLVFLVSSLHATRGRPHATPCSRRTSTAASPSLPCLAWGRSLQPAPAPAPDEGLFICCAMSRISTSTDALSTGAASKLLFEWKTHGIRIEYESNLPSLMLMDFALPPFISESSSGFRSSIWNLDLPKAGVPCAAIHYSTKYRYLYCSILHGSLIKPLQAIVPFRRSALIKSSYMMNNSRRIILMCIPWTLVVDDDPALLMAVPQCICIASVLLSSSAMWKSISAAMSSAQHVSSIMQCPLYYD